MTTSVVSHEMLWKFKTFNPLIAFVCTKVSRSSYFYAVIIEQCFGPYDQDLQTADFDG